MAKNESPFIWDKHSDQPFPIKDKAYKKAKRKENLFDYIPLVFYNIFIFPFAMMLSSLFKPKKTKFPHFFGQRRNKIVSIFYKVF